MNNTLIYVAMGLATIFLCLGLGWEIGLGIAAILAFVLALLIDCTNAIIQAITRRGK